MRHLLIFYYTNLFPYTIFATALVNAVAVQGTKARRENTFKLRVYLSNIKEKNQEVIEEKIKKVGQKGQKFQNYFVIIGLF